MPIKFNETMPNPGVGDVSFKKDYVSGAAGYALGARRAGELGQDLTNSNLAAQKGMDEVPLGQFGSDVASIEEGVVNYRTQEAELINLRDTADAEVKGRYESDLVKLRRGEVAGSLSPQAARVRMLDRKSVV